MPRNTAAEPRYRRPSRRHLARTLRTLKSMLPPPPIGHATSEDLADFLERLVDKCQQMSGGLVQHGGGDGHDAVLPPSPPPSPPEAADDVDNSDEARRLASFSCFSKAAIDDLVEQMLAMEEEEAEPHLL